MSDYFLAVLYSLTCMACGFWCGYKVGADDRPPAKPAPESEEG